MSLDDLAKASGVSRSLIAYYEKGTHFPRPETMVRLIGALDVLPSYFTTSAPDAEPAPIFMRHFKSKARAKQLTAVHRQLPWVRNLVNVIEEYVVLPDVNVPDFHPPSDPRLITTQQIEEAAMHLRRHWALGDGAIRDVIRLIENNGCIVVPEIVDCQAIDAFSQWSQNGRPFIIANSPLVTGFRWRIDVAHELGHLVLHRKVDRRFIELNPTTHKLIESQAFRFAGAFLMPEGSFRKSIPHVSLNHLLLAKTQWHVAMQAMLHRTEDLGMIDVETGRKLWKSVVRRGWKTQEPLDDKTPAEKPHLLANAIRTIHADDPGHMDDVCARTGLSIADISRYCAIPEQEIFATDQALPKIRNRGSLNVAK